MSGDAFNFSLKTKSGRHARRREMLERVVTGDASQQSSSISPPTAAQRPVAQAKVAFFLRTSTDGQAENETIESQRFAVQKIFAKEFGGDERLLVQNPWHEDDGYNLEYDDPSRSIWKLLSRVARGEINTIIVASTSRILRGSNDELNGRIKAALYLGQAVVIDQNSRQTWDKADIGANLINAFTEVINKQEKALISSRLQTGRRSWLAKKIWRLAVVPYGFLVKIDATRHRGDDGFLSYEVVPEEARVIRAIYSLYLGKIPEDFPAPEGKGGVGLTTAEVAEYLNRLGITRHAWIKRTNHRRKKGADFNPAWTTTSVYRVLANPIYMGQMVVHFNPTSSDKNYRADESTETVPVPAIVSPETYREAKLCREEKYKELKLKLEPSEGSTSYWLHGKILCSVCRGTLKGRTSSNGDRYYVCDVKRKPEDPPHLNVRASDVEPVLEPLFREVFREEYTFSRFKARFLGNTSRAIEMRLVEKRLADLKTEADTLADRELSLVEEKRAGVLSVTARLFLQLGFELFDLALQLSVALGDL